MSTTIIAEALRGQLTDVVRLRNFMEAGNATLTFVSKETGQRFTYRFKRPEEEPNKPRPIWVNVMTGPDNETHFEFVGTIFSKHFGCNFSDFRHSPKSRLGPAAKSVTALRWLLGMVYGERQDPAKLFAQAEVWHEGRCGRCGRKLTVPDSIATGFGPECAARRES